MFLGPTSSARLIRRRGKATTSLTTRIAVVSDLHANQEALTAVLKRIKGEKVVCLGDFVDYGAEPNETIAAIKDLRMDAVLGNHDNAALTGDTSMFNASAAVSSVWTRRTLTKESREFLAGLPLSVCIGEDGAKAYFTHGSPSDNLWEYVDPRTHHLLFGYYLKKVDAGLIGLGHTHIPYVWTEAEGAVFNPGSVGQPRDGDRRASWADVSIGAEGVDVRIERVEYDFKKAADKIRAAGLPESHAARLASGT